MLLLVTGMQVNSRKSLSGYTLIEVLLVIVIIAIISTVAVLVFSNFGHGRQVTMVAHRLSQTIRVAQQEAILRPMVLGMRFTAQGYQFYKFEINKKSKESIWQTLTNDKLSCSDAFSHGVVIKRFELNHKTKTNKSYVVFSSSGDVSPFSLVVTDKRRDRTYKIAVRNNGMVSLKELFKR